MAGRLDYSISVTAIQQGSQLEGTTPEAVEADIGRSLGGGNSSLTWAGNAVAGWSAGTCTHTEAVNSATTVAASGDNGIWIRHTGKAFDDTATGKIDEATANTESVNVSVGSQALCVLGSGDCIFIPTPSADIKIANAAGDDTGPAIEVAKLT